MSVKTVPGALDILNQKLGGNAGDIPASSTKEYALEKIYRTLGGEETLEGVNTTSEIIEKIAGVAEGGGGGSSDFSTARATITLSGTPDISEVIHIPYITVNGELVTIPVTASATYIVPLLLDTLVIVAPSNRIIRNITNITGDVSLSESDKTIRINGDCAFTINYSTPV